MARRLLKFDNHSDWVFGTTFTLNGKRILSGSRDRAMKLIDAANGQFIDDINKLLERVLCIARHPKEDVVVYGGESGIARTYKIADNQSRTVANNDANLLKEFERLPGPVQAVAYSPDGKLIALGGSNPEVRLYDAKRGQTSRRPQGPRRRNLHSLVQSSNQPGRRRRLRWQSPHLRNRQRRTHQRVYPRAIAAP